MLKRRKFSNPDLELAGDLALHTLGSYHYVMADQESIPPFIHPKYQSLMEPGTNRPSPVYAANKLAKVLFLGRGMNKTLIWSLIRMEQERLLNHVRFAILGSAYLILMQIFTPAPQIRQVGES